MFSKPARETPKSQTTSSMPDLKLPENLVLDAQPQAPSLTPRPSQQIASNIKDKEMAESSELVTSVEKISRIVSPYFIAIVGLSLYRENFFLGTILISVGILSLLKVSAKDVAAFLEWLKDFLGFGEDEVGL